MIVINVPLPVPVSTFYLASLVGTPDCTAPIDNANLTLFTNASDFIPTSGGAPDISVSGFNATSAKFLTEAVNGCDPDYLETAMSTKIVYALWVWCIYFTFPGTYSMQPAITTQTFGHKYATDL